MNDRVLVIVYYNSNLFTVVHGNKVENRGNANAGGIFYAKIRIRHPSNGPNLERHEEHDSVWIGYSREGGMERDRVEAEIVPFFGLYRLECSSLLSALWLENDVGAKEQTTQSSTIFALFLLK
ncbi:unnamed protein product [Sphenostylis stenocarpa]|uniref:Uncharacterized protein n=1 Tax=Sphenostylis stenocarpa TaxID=92480 RepID=A0AA86VU19_9FABA|nr:unnamed protein product [Sphenostylis stenocarpa]